MFNQFFGRFSASLRQFMAGRYGNDHLNMALLGVGVVCSLLSMFIRVAGVNMILTMISYGFLGLVIFRSLSRNTYKRYQENRKYRQMVVAVTASHKLSQVGRESAEKLIEHT